MLVWKWSCARMKIAGYLPLWLEPGHHVVSLKPTLFGNVMDTELSRIEFEVKESEVKYFEYTQFTTGYTRYGNTEVAEVKEYFMEVPAKYASRALAKTKLLRPD